MDDLNTKKPGSLPTEKEMESWFGMLDDASKAEVMKAKITADADVKKAELSSDNFQLGNAVHRVGKWVALVLIALFSSCTSMCVADKWQDVQNTKIKAEHPDYDRLAADRANAEANAKNAETCRQYPQNCKVTITTVQAAAPPASAAPASSEK